MVAEHRDCELWRENDWRCEQWTVAGRPEVRLYLGSFKVSELMDGPEVDIWEQVTQWRRAAHDDSEEEISRSCDR